VEGRGGKKPNRKTSIVDWGATPSARRKNKLHPERKKISGREIRLFTGLALGPVAAAFYCERAR